MKIIFLTSIFLLLSSVFVWSNNKTLDSLWLVHKNAKHDTIRIKTLLNIAAVYNKPRADSTFLILNSALQIVNKYIPDSLHEKPIEFIPTAQLKTLLTFAKLKVDVLRALGMYYEDTEKIQFALNTFQKACSLAKRLNYILGVARIYTNLGQHYTQIDIYDSATYYFTTSIGYFEKIQLSKDSAEQHEGKIGMAICYLNLGNLNEKKGNYETAIENYQKSMLISEKLNDSRRVAKCYNNLGIVHLQLGNYDKSIENFLTGLKINEKNKDKLSMAQSYMGLGNVHTNQGNYDKAIEYYNSALKNYTELNNNRGKAKCYNNLGAIYYFQAGELCKKKSSLDEIETMFQKALEQFALSLKISEEFKEKYGVCGSYTNMGMCYKDLGDELDKRKSPSFLIREKYDLALQYFTKALKIAEEIKSKYYLIVCYSNLGSIYNSFAFFSGSDPTCVNKAIYYGEKAYAIAKEINALPRINETADLLIMAYKKSGNYQKALEYAEIFIATKDSMFKEEKTKSLIDAEEKFKSEKKQLEIDKLSKEKELQQSELLRQQETSRRQKLVIVFIILGIILITIFAIFIAQRLRITRKQKKIIEEQKLLVDEKNMMLNQQNEEIRAQRDEIDQQNQHLTKAYEIIEHKNKNITDSIRYALRIQTAMLPPQELFNRLIPENFILYKPKSIVSGDFYWIDKKDNFVFIAAVDCTGHGVPGAFMSIVGYNLLNQALNEKNITEPALILNYLSASVSKTLRQNETDESVKDGMDLVLLRIDTIEHKIVFAGVHNPIYQIKNNELFEYKGDKWPINKPFSEKFNTYTSQEIQVQKGDLFYLFSDGYMDQFGETGKKFSSAKFRELLLSIHHEPMPKQKEILDKTFIEWKGKSEQIDDVMVIGIRI